LEQQKHIKIKFWMKFGDFLLVFNSNELVQTNLSIFLQI
jgi:hypothetical protein